MNKFFITKYNLTRNSKHDYKYAVVYQNLSNKTEIQIGAQYHSTRELAEKNPIVRGRYSHLKFLEIVEIEKVDA